MTIRLLTIDDYYRAFPRSLTPFGSEAFVRLNAGRADAVRCFAAYDERSLPRLGIVMGWDAASQSWQAPFSAPFAEVSYDEPQSLERVYDFVAELRDTLSPHPVRVTLAPDYYDPVMLPRLCGMLHGAASRTILDYDFYYPLSQTADFAAHMSHAARKNHARAMQAGFTFSPTDDIARAYAIIKANRDSHGYPLAMTLDQVVATTATGDPARGIPAPVRADFFLLTLDGADVAAAMAYRINADIAMVVYWGDAPGYSHLRPMNALPHLLFAHFAALGFKTVDIGPSSTNGIPNPGLCRFKDSLGCLTALRPTFILNA